MLGENPKTPASTDLQLSFKIAGKTRQEAILKTPRHPVKAPASGPTHISETEFCARFGLCRRTVQRWRVSGDGPQWVRLGAKRVAYRIADIEAWAAERTFTHRAEEFAGA